MKYIINNEKTKELFVQIDSKLALVEVKGESVGHLYVVRGMLKEIFSSLEEFDDKKEKKAE